MAKAAVVKERHSCSECACFKPYTDRQRLSMKGEVFWGWCPIKKLSVLLKGTACADIKKTGAA